MMDVVIPTYNPNNKLLRTVKALDSDVVDKVIVVDDHSQRTEYIKKARKFDYVEIYRNKENSGQGLSRNLGFKKSNSKKVMFLDDDVLIKESSLKEINGLLDNHDSVIFTPYKHLEPINEVNFIRSGNFFAFKGNKFKEHGGFIRFRRREDLDIVLRAIERNFKIIGYSEGVHHLSNHNPRIFYDWITNVIFNIVYFNLHCMRFQFFHKPIRLIEILTGWKCPLCKEMR